MKTVTLKRLLDKIWTSFAIFCLTSWRVIPPSFLRNSTRLLSTLKAPYLFQNRSKPRTISNLITQETKGTINSISRFWSFLRSFRKLSTLKKRSKRPSFWIAQSCYSRNATEKSELLIPPTAVGWPLNITRVTLLPWTWRTTEGFARRRGRP